MSMLLPRNEVEPVLHPDQLRELIPRYLRVGILRRVGLPDGGIEFVEERTDRVIATIDGRGRFVL